MSLYPWLSYYYTYPVGHPTIVTNDLKVIKDHFGVTNVKTLPCVGLYYVVPPCRSKDRFKVSLYRLCAGSENKTHANILNKNNN
jgi:hypothetical protein